MSLKQTVRIRISDTCIVINIISLQFTY